MNESEFLWTYYLIAAWLIAGFACFACAPKTHESKRLYPLDLIAAAIITALGPFAWVIMWCSTVGSLPNPFYRK